MAFSFSGRSRVKYPILPCLSKCIISNFIGYSSIFLTSDFQLGLVYWSSCRFPSQPRTHYYDASHFDHLNPRCPFKQLQKPEIVIPSLLAVASLPAVACLRKQGRRSEGSAF